MCAIQHLFVPFLVIGPKKWLKIYQTQWRSSESLWTECIEDVSEYLRSHEYSLSTPRQWGGDGGRFWVEAFKIRFSRKIWTPLCCDDRFMGNCFWIDSVVTKTLSLIILFLDWRHVSFYRHWWELLWSFHGYTLILWSSPFIPKNAVIFENVKMRKHLWCEKSKRSCLLGSRPLDLAAAPGV